MQTCTPSEIRTLVCLAQGYMHIGNSGAHMMDWGYNSAKALFSIVAAGETSEGWFQIFPHSLLEGWPEIERSPAAQAAYKFINGGVGFIEPPPGFCTALNVQQIVRNEYKLVSNWGAEYGSIRGWAITSSAEFVRSGSEVPILGEIGALLETGNLGTAWGTAYNSTVKRFARENKLWKPYTGTLCWIQLMMLDTWIAQRVDLLMQGITDQALIPVDEATANKYAFLAVQGPKTKRTTSGRKHPRALFILHYLAHLADGIIDNQGTRVGVSCMSPGNGHGAAGWAGMELGNADDWAALDAMLTLRAILMATRLELMFNTDVFLEFQQCRSTDVQRKSESQLSSDLT
ncbi:hypothetical protein B0H16DRAFT_1466742 [Mycena metata]|uniref:Uncharacterized protein n=1 Tax=Mycena metata TaxID=1033252 RepID=A0AAD7I6P7_9AGAR|nr:hypothetical protein B0H16DRAFT_1466742 [Mycena metata]